MSWSTPLFEPIALPGGRELVTLQDAGDYVTRLPAREQRKDHWQHAAHALMLGERAGGGHLAWMAMLHALNHGKAAPAKEPRRKLARVTRIVR